MLFRRRTPLSLAQMIRFTLAPKSGYKRAFSYAFERIRRSSGSPYAISAGVAAGTFASFTPFLGFHLLIAIMLSIIIRGNYLVAGFSTLIGNPLTIPIIWTLNYNIGILMIGGQAKTSPSIPHPMQRIENIGESNFFVNSFNNFWTMLMGEIGWPLLVGSIPCGILAAITVYLITNKSVKIYRKSKMHLRRMEKRKTKGKKAHSHSNPETGQ